MAMRQLPREDWILSVREGSIYLSGWTSGPEEDIRYWVKFDPSSPFDDRICLDNLKGVVVDIIHSTAVS